MSNLLSVIVPVYQTKEYLEQCVKSILCQSYNNIQVLLVDDGSTDGSSELCDKLASYDDRITVIHSHNIGPYAARKLGVIHSKGNVITFMDSDDWIENNAYEELMALYQEYQPSIISFDYRLNEDTESEISAYAEGYYNRCAIEKEVIPTMLFDIEYGGRRLNPSLCCKIIKKDLYMKVVRDLDAYITLGEDAIVTYPAVCESESIYILHKPYYHYRMNETSCTHLYPYERIGQVKVFQENIKKMLKKYLEKYDFSFQIDCYVRTFIEMMLTNWYGIHRSGTMYVFPYKYVEPNSKVQIYGAGEVGKSYYVSLKQSKYAEVMGWYDRNAKNGDMYFGNTQILDPQYIKNEEADKIIIAINDPVVAEEIKLNLIREGISADKVFWSKPYICM